MAVPGDVERGRGHGVASDHGAVAVNRAPRRPGIERIDRGARRSGWNRPEVVRGTVRWAAGPGQRRRDLVELDGQRRGVRREACVVRAGAVEDLTVRAGRLRLVTGACGRVADAVDASRAHGDVGAVPTAAAQGSGRNRERRARSGLVQLHGQRSGVRGQTSVISARAVEHLPGRLRRLELRGRAGHRARDRVRAVGLDRDVARVPIVVAERSGCDGECGAWAGRVELERRRVIRRRVAGVVGARARDRETGALGSAVRPRLARVGDAAAQAILTVCRPVRRGRVPVVAAVRPVVECRLG